MVLIKSITVAAIEKQLSFEKSSKKVLDKLETMSYNK